MSDTAKIKEEDKFEKPVIEMADGIITITSLPGAVIRYTKNNHSPKEDDALYEGPFEVTAQDQKIRAKAWLNGLESKIATKITRITLTLKLNIYPIEEKGSFIVKNKILAAIKHFRATAATVVNTVVVAESALATWNSQKERVESAEKKDVKLILGEMCGKRGKGNPIEARIKKLAPTWNSPLVQECRQLIETALSSKDPEKTKVPRQVLINSQERKAPDFRYVGLPILCCKSTEANVKWNGFHRVSLRWDNELGFVEFGVCGKRKKDKKSGNISYGLEPYQIGVLKSIQSKEYQQGTTDIMENDGDLFLCIPYSYVPKNRETDPTRIMELCFTDDQQRFISAKMDSRGSHRNEIDLAWNQQESCIAAVDQLKRLKGQSSYVEEVRRACGSKRERKQGSGHPAGYRAASERGDRLMKCRDGAVKTWNHIWSARIVSWATSRDCGRIEVFDIPAQLFGWPWQFSDFKSKLEYKAREKGIVVNFENESSEKMIQNIKEAS